MTLRERLAAGISFRTSTPTYAAGEEITAHVTGANGSTPLVRIGDSVIELLDADPSLVDATVRLKVEEFDDATHRGRAKLLEVLEEPE